MCRKKNLIITSLLIIAIAANIILGYFFKSSLLLVTIMMGVVFIYIYDRNEDTLKFFVLYTVFQNIVLIISSSVMTGTESTLMILMKEMMVYLCAGIFLSRKCFYNFKKIDVISILFFVYSFFHVILISSDLNLGIIGLRQVLVVFFCFYFGMSIRNTKEEMMDRLCIYIIYIATIVAITGLIIILLPVDFWNSIGYADYWYNKTGNLSYDLNAFYTYDLGFKMKRMVSIFADPLANSHFLGLAFVILFSKYKKSGFYLSKLVITVALVLGLSKSTVLLIACIIIANYYFRIKKKVLRCLFTVSVILIGIFVILKMFGYASSLIQATSMGNHINSFKYGLMNASLMGTGYGSVGYNAIMMGADISREGLESFFSTLMGQSGIIGVVLMYGFLIMILTEMLKNYFKNKNINMQIALILLISTMIETLLSASAISMLGTGLYFCIIGVVYKIYCEGMNVNNENFANYF